MLHGHEDRLREVERGGVPVVDQQKVTRQSVTNFAEKLRSREPAQILESLLQASQQVLIDARPFRLKKNDCIL